MNIILRIIISAIVAFALSYILSGVHIQSFVTAIVLAIVLGLLNIFVKPILIILINEQADEVVARLYSDYCSNAGVGAPKAGPADSRRKK